MSKFIIRDKDEEIDLCDLIGCVKLLQSQVNELRWHVNATSNHLHMHKNTAACCMLHAGGYDECQ